MIVAYIKHTETMSIILVMKTLSLDGERVQLECNFYIPDCIPSTGVKVTKVVDIPLQITYPVRKKEHLPLCAYHYSAWYRYVYIQPIKV